MNNCSPALLILQSLFSLSPLAAFLYCSIVSYHETCHVTFLHWVFVLMYSVYVLNLSDYFAGVLKIFKQVKQEVTGLASHLITIAMIMSTIY